MQGPVDEHRRRLDRVTTGQRRAAGIDHDDVGGLDFAPEQAARVEQESAGTVGKLGAEMVADAFGQAVQRRRAQAEREVFAQAQDRVGFEIQGVSADRRHRCSRSHLPDLGLR